VTRLLPTVALSFCVALPTVLAPQSEPPHLLILFANIAELPPIDSQDVANRQVVLRIQLAQTPSCTSRTNYGFLIDADKSAATGATDPAFSNLGIDARISARCDPRTGSFVSSVGPVTITVDAVTGTALLEILTTVSRLPSVDFQWIAFAQEDTLFTRLPEDPNEPGAWATLEITEH
jgi:hypothetical protein